MYTFFFTDKHTAYKCIYFISICNGTSSDFLRFDDVPHLPKVGGKTWML